MLGIKGHAALLAAALTMVTAETSLAEIAGKRPTVIDGDTFDLAGARITLHGIDAPELDQLCRYAGKPWACGEAARQALIRRISFHWVNCVVAGHDEDGRPTSVCYLGAVGGPELNEWMVSQGWALADPVTGSGFKGQESLARTERRGLWGARFVVPWAWRQGQRLPVD